MKTLMAAFFLVGLVSLGLQAQSAPLPLPLKTVEGYQIQLISNQVRGARFIAVAPNGDIVVALISEGRVVAVDQNSAPDSPPRMVIGGLPRPNAVVFRGNDLYIADNTGVVRIKDYPRGIPETLINDLPVHGGHMNRALALDAQGNIFVSSGSDCNICVEHDPRLASILRYNADGTRGRIFASGLRNASGLAFDSRGRLWAVVNQRDNLAPDHTDLPPDELDLIQEGGNYGWPTAYPDGNKRLANPEFPGASVADFLPTTLNIQAHSAPLEIALDSKTETLFIAYQGSWNRVPPTGYKVVRVDLGAEWTGKPKAPEDFVTGWLTPRGRVLAHPIGVALGPDSSLYISDDSGNIFKVTKS